MAHVIMTTHWTGGDVYPFIRMGSLLQAHGHTVTLVTHCSYEEKARRAGLNFAAFDTPEEWAEFVVDDAKIGNPLSNLQGVLDFRAKYQCKARYLREYEIIARHATAPDTVLFVRHVDSVAALLAAEKLRLPIATIYMAPSFLTQIGTDEELFGDSLLAELNATRAALDLPPARSWLAWWTAPKRVLGLWPGWFESNTSVWPTPVTPVGFALDANENLSELPPEVEEFLALHQSPVLISGGTGKQLKAGFYDVSVDACRLSGRPALLVTQHEDLVPKDLPAHVRWFRYLPFARLMPLMGSIIHHGGVNTCSQALSAGIPQLVLGYYYDRPGNGMRLKRLGVADYLPPIQWTPEQVADSLAQIMTPEVRARCHDYAERIRTSDFGSVIPAQVADLVGNEQLLIDPRVFLADAAQPGAEQAAARRAQTGLPEQVKDVSAQKRALMAQLLWQRKAAQE